MPMALFGGQYIQGVFFNWCSPKIHKYGEKLMYLITTQSYVITAISLLTASKSPILKSVGRMEHPWTIEESHESSNDPGPMNHTREAHENCQKTNSQPLNNHSAETTTRAGGWAFTPGNFRNLRKLPPLTTQNPRFGRVEPITMKLWQCGYFQNHKV